MQKLNLMQMWMLLVRAYVVRANQVCAYFNLLVVLSKTVSTRPRRPRPRFATRWTIKEVNQRETRRMLTFVYLCTLMTLCAVRCDDLSGLKSILRTCAWAPANSAAATALQSVHVAAETAPWLRLTQTARVRTSVRGSRSSGATSWQRGMLTSSGAASLAR